jgi:uncharacterized metal-binding protein YceD (DUF177 family)
MKAPLSHTIVAADVPAAGRHVRVEADEEERRALAQALAIPAIEALSAEIELRPARGRSVSVRGRLAARVVQTDVVTLDPVTQAVEEEIDVVLVPAEARASGRAELVDAEEADGPDLYRNGRIDLGVIVSEHLALGLDPYPRAPETDFSGYIEDDPAADPSPFAALAGLAQLKARED